MKRRFWMTLVSLVVVMAMLLSACGPGGGTAPGAADGTAPAGQAGERDTIVIANTVDIDGLDPQQTSSLFSMMMVTQIFDTLVRGDAQGNLNPQLAESWERADDGMSYTFNLRRGVLFHNGDELTASDVVFSVERGMASPFAGAIFGPVAGAEALDEYTVRIDLRFEYGPFLSAMSAPLASIVNQRAVEAYGDEFMRNPVGTAAYQFVSWDPGDRVVVRAFDGWHGGRAPIENLIWRVLPDPTTAVIALENGEIDLLLSVPPAARQNILDNANLEIYEIASHRHHYIGFNTEMGVFSDVRVRQAVAKAIDREGMTLVASEGMGQVAINHLAPTIFGFTDTVQWYERNIDAARELLTLAGLEGGFNIRVICMDGEGRNIAQVLQDNLNALNISTSIEVMDRAALVELGRNGDFDIIVFTWSTPVPDADYTLNFLFHSNMINAMNYSRFNNPEMDRLIEQGAASSDTATRLALYAQALQLLKDEVPTIPIYFETVSIAANRDLRNVTPSPSSTYYFYELSW